MCPIFGFLVKLIINKNSHNSRISNDIDIKIKPPSKFDKRNVMTSKNRWRNVNKLLHHRHFPDLWVIWSNPKARIRMHSLRLLLLYS